MRFIILSYQPWFIFFISLAFHTPSLAQKNKTWPSAIDYKLKGKVKSWTMFSEGKEVRRQQFDKNNLLVDDTWQGTVQTYTAPEYLPEKYKAEFEKVYKVKPVWNDTAVKMVFNDRMQLLETKTPGYHLVNTFNREGKIQVSRKTEIITHTSAWNSIRHPEPTHTYSYTIQSLTVFKYNKAGKLLEFEHFHSDPFQNLRMLYSYDSANNLVESSRYDRININLSFFNDSYLKKLHGSDIDSAFDINRIYKGYWNQGLPSRQTWKYDSNGNKIEYLVFGYRNGLSFKATWEYDRQGRLTRETHHDVYHNTISAVIDYDKRGNVIQETNFDYWQKTKYQYRYEIRYY